MTLFTTSVRCWCRNIDRVLSQPSARVRRYQISGLNHGHRQLTSHHRNLTSYTESADSAIHVADNTGVTPVLSARRIAESANYGIICMRGRTFSTTTAKNGKKGSNDYKSLENVFDDRNKAKVIEGLKHAKHMVRPTKIAEYPRKAAVLVPLCRVNGEPSLLFMKRSLHLKNHAGEICFPGGMEDEGDNSMADTALRETQEEIGIDTATVDVWGTAPPVPSRHGHQVYPVLGYCHDLDLKKMTLSEAEVHSVFTRPIASFLIIENQRQTQFRYPGSKGYTLPVFTDGEHSEHAVWGLTAIITHQILKILTPELYTFKPKLRH